MPPFRRVHRNRELDFAAGRRGPLGNQLGFYAARLRPDRRKDEQQEEKKSPHDP